MDSSMTTLTLLIPLFLATLITACYGIDVNQGKHILESNSTTSNATTTFKAENHVNQANNTNSKATVIINNRSNVRAGGGGGGGGGGGSGGGNGWGWGGGGGGGFSWGWGGGGGGGGGWRWQCGRRPRHNNNGLPGRNVGKSRSSAARGGRSSHYHRGVYRMGEYAECMGEGRCKGLRLDCPLHCSGRCFYDCEYMCKAHCIPHHR